MGQDCEINAAKRLLARLKKEYPRLPVCLQGEALYAAGPIMELCCENKWRYIFTQKATHQKALVESYEWIKSDGGSGRGWERAWNPLVREIGQSIKNTSSRLLESFRRQPITDEDVLYIRRYTTVYLE